MGVSPGGSLQTGIARQRETRTDGATPDARVAKCAAAPIAFRAKSRMSWSGPWSVRRLMEEFHRTGDCLLHPGTKGSELEDFRFSAHDLCQLPLHGHEVNQREARAGFKLREHIHVAFRAEVVPDDGTEQGELPDPVFLAERGDLVSGDRQAGTHGRNAVRAA